MNSHTATDVADWLRLRIHEFSRFNSRENEKNEDEDEDEDS